MRSQRESELDGDEEVSRTTHVLHVVDRISGGVPIAVLSYIRNSPVGYVHAIVSPFIDGEPPAVWRGLPVALYDLGDGHIERIGRVRALARLVHPDVVHAHSSFAGGYVRLALWRGKTKIVYSPHCFSFERRDLGILPRAVAFFIEALLAANTDVIAACSASEQRRARCLLRLARGTEQIPNTASTERRTYLPVRASGPRDGLRLGMIGRISAQKDPRYFLNVVRHLRASGLNGDAVWIGDGDPIARAALIRAGVAVTGWLLPEEVSAHLRTLDLYVHTAAWEGFPISVLDAHASGLAILVRPISAFEGTAERTHVSARVLRESTAIASNTERSGAWQVANRESWSEYLALNTDEEQRRALEGVWCHGGTRGTEGARARPWSILRIVNARRPGARAALVGH